jgi:hypothetical protein
MCTKHPFHQTAELSSPASHQALRWISFGALDRPGMPGVFTEDHIDGTFAVGVDADDASKRIIRISVANLNRGVMCAQGVPESRLENAGINGENVNVERRPRDTTGGEGGGADEGVSNSPLLEQRNDMIEQRHGWPTAAARLTVRPRSRCWRRRRRASSRASPLVRANSARSSSPSDSETDPRGHGHVQHARDRLTTQVVHRAHVASIAVRPMLAAKRTAALQCKATRT